MTFPVSLNRLPEFARWFWERAGTTRVFAFHGPMGAGKTTLITALGRDLGVEEAMSSPTFSIINEYAFEQQGQARTLYHIDLYRLERAGEAQQAGVEDAVYSGELCFVEWPERSPELFEAALHVSVEPDAEDPGLRHVRMEQTNNRNL